MWCGADRLEIDVDIDRRLVHTGDRRARNVEPELARLQVGPEEIAVVLRFENHASAHLPLILADGREPLDLEAAVVQLGDKLNLAEHHERELNGADRDVDFGVGSPQRAEVDWFIRNRGAARCRARCGPFFRLVVYYLFQLLEVMREIEVIGGHGCSDCGLGPDIHLE